MLEELDSRKRKLLEERMTGKSPSAADSPSTAPLKFSPANVNLEINKVSPQETVLESQESTTVVLADSSSVDLFNSNSNSNSNSIAKQDAWKEQVSSFRLEDENNSRGAKRSEEVVNESSNEKSPKHYKSNGGKAESVLSPPGFPEFLLCTLQFYLTRIIAESGSREANQSKKTTIASYFSKPNSNVSGGPPQINDIVHSSKAAAETARENSSSTAPVVTAHPTGSNKLVKEKMQVSATAIACPTGISGVGVGPSITDQRKFNEMEQRIQRMEADLQVSGEDRKRTQETNIKLRKCLEDVYRKMAIQDQRRRRDRLAADCVRVGKLVTQRTGPTSVAEVWEEGYALKDLNRRSAELLVRKEEIEKRKKRLAAEKRKRKGNSDSLEGAVDTTEPDSSELDMIAEENAIKSHSDELRKDGEALAEERRLLDSEKAAHLKEIRRCQSEDHSRFTRDLPCKLSESFAYHMCDVIVY